MFNEIKIGADPELAVINEDNHPVTVRGVFKNIQEDAQFGIDGAGKDFELRPSPNIDPEKVVNNIGELLAQGKKTLGKALDGHFLVAGSGPSGHPIGGHIHFGHARLKRNDAAGNSRNVQNLVHSLDYYLAPICALLEDQEDFLRRRSSYGLSGDHRDQQWGIEYRTLSSWLTCPDVSKGVLYLAKAITDVEAPPVDKLTKIKQAHDSYNHDLLKKSVLENRDTLSKTAIYKGVPEAKRTIDFLYSLVEDDCSWMTGDSVNGTVSPTYVLSSWGLREPHIDRIVIKKELVVKSIKELI